MKRYTTALFALLSMGALALSPLAATCPALVERAFTTSAQACADLGRNEACYGHVLLTPDWRDTDELPVFERQGDTARLEALEGLHLSPFDLELGQWGIALMRLQANIPDTLPGQNVLFLMFGDVEVRNAVHREARDMRPMQAFHLRSGAGPLACDVIPESGLIVQTPHGVGRVHLNVNGVRVTLGSTAFLQAQPGGYLAVKMLEGSAHVEFDQHVVIAVAGTQVRVPLDANGLAAGIPSRPEPYELESHLYLPIELLQEDIPFWQSADELELSDMQEDDFSVSDEDDGLSNDDDDSDGDHSGSSGDDDDRSGSNSGSDGSGSIATATAVAGCGDDDDDGGCGGDD